MKTFMQYLVENQVVDYLTQLKNAGYKILAHQTNSNNAKSIIGGKFGNNGGVNGTALMVNPENIETTLGHMRSKIDGVEGSYHGLVHGDSDTIVLMAVPSVVQGMKIKSINDVDDVLVELGVGLNVPNENIIGYALPDGQIVRNPNFDPKKSPLQ